MSSFRAYGQRLKDIMRGYPLPNAQEGLTLSPKGRPTTGDFLTPSAPLPCPYLRHLSTVCLGEISKNQRQQLTKFADVISRDSKASTFRGSCTSGSWQIPSSSARHQALREDEAQGSWLPLLPGARAAAGTRFTDTLSQLDEKGRGSRSFRVVRAEEDRQACDHCAKEQMLWTVTELKEHSYRFWNAGSRRRPSGTKLGKA